MVLLLKDLELSVEESQKLGNISSLVAKKLGIDANEVVSARVHKKSLDARHKSKIVYRYQLAFEARQEAKLKSMFPYLEETSSWTQGTVKIDVEPKKFRHRPLIIGSGPAGIFAALCLQESGVSSHIVERGEPVEKRIKTVNKLRVKGEFNAESNFCYGEGGAGTFSDGKLTCGRNHPLIRYIFGKFHEFGAPESILYEAHPHIGTDYLLNIALRMRKHLIAQGSEFSFNKIFTSFRSGGKHARYIVSFADGDEIATDHLILAIGHSARDTYQKLYDLQMAMAPKPFAMGARIEHPQAVIDEIQYGRCEMLPAAEYKLVARAGERGIWTFCMCPGGNLLPTPAQEHHLAINGMSYHSRNSGFANAAVVVNVLREDFFKGHPLDGMHFQAALEQKAFQAGGGNYYSPAQKLVDFLGGRASSGELRSTYRPGVVSARLDRVLPDFITDSLKAALIEYNKRMQGYLSSDALIVGLESKTSAPITMLRDQNLQSVSHPGIFPCGEGAGFAGGIVSATLDGLKVGQAVLGEVAKAQSCLI